MVAVYTSYDQLPLTLCAEDISAVLGISREGAYRLLRSSDFPTVRIGKRMFTTKDAFIEWVNAKAKPMAV